VLPERELRRGVVGSGRRRLRDQSAQRGAIVVIAAAATGGGDDAEEEEEEEGGGGGGGEQPHGSVGFWHVFGFFRAEPSVRFMG
jgi:hypothetical protein